ncbi:MAG TPA: PIN domain-containing protein [Gammaproteobacteria bacterium]
MAGQRTAAGKKKAKRRVQSYAFIDTNIFLDFYRGKTEATLSLLNKLEAARDRVICTYQVEMEFLKNRQEQIKKILSDASLSIDASLPAVFADSHLNTSVRNIKAETAKRNKQLKERILRLLQNPGQNDRVFQTLDSIFKNPSQHVLTRDMQVRHRIKRLAWRRFVLGYPPRKAKDNSIGDALNWEWIIHCANELPGRFYIVSKDSDFGCEHMGQYVLNDQLKAEFRDRVGRKSIRFTHKLSEALEALHVPVTAKEKESEAERRITPSDFLERLRQVMAVHKEGSKDSGPLSQAFAALADVDEEKE